MPSEAFAFMSEADLAALIAYLKQLPPVDRAMPASALGPLGRALLVAGQLSILVAEKTLAMPYPAAVPSGPTAEYGRYLAGFSGCLGCHGPGLSGGHVDGPPDTPPASNLTLDSDRHPEMDGSGLRTRAAARRETRRPANRRLHAVAQLLGDDRRRGAGAVAVHPQHAAEAVREQVSRSAIDDGIVVLDGRLEQREARVAKLEHLPDRIDGLALQTLQLRREMHHEFSALRNEMHDEFSALRSAMRNGSSAVRVEIRAGDEETRHDMRVLHEEVIGRLAAIQAGQDATRPRGKAKNK